MSAGNRGTWALALLVVLGTLAIYARVGGHEFVAFDDDAYVTDNVQVKAGLTLEGARWALGASHASNWHPLTWLSHMLDVELFGLDAGAHHWTSVFLHAGTALILFLFLARTTERPLAAFFCAALFAWHPLRVESVAWVSERKDVLSGLFFALTLWCYGRWSTSRRPAIYAACLLLFALGLLAKPMLVTLPFLLLLLDVWPLKRTGSPGLEDRNGLRRRLLEKLPFLALAVVSSIVTLIVQQAGGAVVSSRGVAPLLRIENALASGLVYVQQTLWPAELACFYPHAQAVEADPFGVLLLPALQGGALLFAATYFVLRARSRAPAALVGWFWYLGMLVPVVGLIQVGTQAHADRYTYLPGIGLSILVVYGLSGLRPLASIPKHLVTGFGAVVLIVLGFTSQRQVAVWRDSQALFEHALAVTDKNYRAHGNLGYALLAGGDATAALPHLERSVQLFDADVAVRTNLGIAYLRLDRLERAREVLGELARVAPNDWRVLSHLGEARFRSDDLDGAVAAYRRALEVGSPLVGDQVNLGMAHLAAGQSAQAERAFAAGVTRFPDVADLHYGLGMSVLAQDRPRAALLHFDEALRLEPGQRDAEQGRSRALARLRQQDAETERERE